MMSSRLSRKFGSAALRGIHTRRKTINPYSISPSLLENGPKQTVEMDTETFPEDENYYHRNPVTSAHAIDLEKGVVSTQDSVALSPTGSVVHAQYGDLGDAADTIPLEYLALLRYAAEGAAAVRTVSKQSGPGTLLVYGATSANGFAATQLATAAGHAVVGVVTAQHSWNSDMVEYAKAMIPEPGTAVAEEYAMAKKNFADLVESISTGVEGLSCHSPEEYLEEFKLNLADYTEKYPETMPAAVDPSTLKFGGMEKDKDEFRANMEAYLSQLPPGAPPIDKQQLDSYFTTEQYQIFRNKFWEQTTKIISGDESYYFSPPHIVKDLIKTPEELDTSVHEGAGPEFPYSFSTINQFYPQGTEAKAGGPVIGAVISVTPELEVAAKAVDAAVGLRAKAEALYFLNDLQKGAFATARSVVSAAQKAGAPVVVIGGSLPGFESVEPTDADVQEVLSAMQIQDDGTSKMNYFIQVYRAGDYPFYADYAVHRATEPLSGPRQIVVTK